jgi:hypothetical protein
MLARTMVALVAVLAWEAAPASANAGSTPFAGGRYVGRLTTVGKILRWPLPKLVNHQDYTVTFTRSGSELRVDVARRDQDLAETSVGTIVEETRTTTNDGAHPNATMLQVRFGGPVHLAHKQAHARKRMRGDEELPIRDASGTMKLVIRDGDGRITLRWQDTVQRGPIRVRGRWNLVSNLLVRDWTSSRMLGVLDRDPEP